MNCLPVIFYVIRSGAKRVGSITWIFRLHNETCAASPGGKRYNSEMTVAKCEKENLQQLVADSEVGIIFKIPWGIIFRFWQNAKAIEIRHCILWDNNWIVDL